MIDTDTPTFETEEQAAFRRANYGNTNNLHGISTISGKQGPTKKSSSGNAGTMNLNEIRANSMEAYLKAHGQ